jgi:hypothetical protein
MIFAEIRDPRLVTVRRGGTLSDADHHLLATWAADCAEHVLHFFEEEQPADERPRRAIELARAWVRGEVLMTQSRNSAGHANAAARDLSGAAREAGRLECQWQRAQLPDEIRELVLDDQRLRNEYCWFLFSC